jgi:hypothetical protein
MISRGSVDIPRKSGTYTTVPSTWRSSGGADRRAKYGIATYRLTVILPETGTLALRMPPLDSAYVIYFNGTLLGGNGSVSDDSAETRILEYSPLIFRLTSKAGSNEIVVHMANYVFPRADSTRT